MVPEVLLGHHGVNGNLADSRIGQPPVTWAARGGHAGVVRMILERQDVDVNMVDSEFGMTPLLWALTKRHEEVAKPPIELPGVSGSCVDWNDAFGLGGQ